MDIYAPSYYKKFVCIADKCKNSCCIDWEIDIDSDTYEKYIAEGGRLSESITEADGCRCFELKDGRCPHLTETGLCEIIMNYGESYLTEICREHPRFYNHVGCRIEAGLGLVCEEAARIILTDTESFSMEKIGEDESIRSECPDFAAQALRQRDSMIAAVLAEGMPLQEKIRILEREYRVSVGIHSMEEWLDILSELEILDGRWRDILISVGHAEKVNDTEHLSHAVERALVYFIYRHVPLAASPENLRARLGFALLGAEIINYVTSRSESADIDTLLYAARLYSSEIEYSEDNTAEIIFEFESSLSD